MEETFQLATDVVTRLIAEDRAPTPEEKALLAKMIGVLLFDIHSIAKSLATIAEADQDRLSFERSRRG